MLFIMEEQSRTELGGRCVKRLGRVCIQATRSIKIQHDQYLDFTLEIKLGFWNNVTGERESAHNIQGY